MLRFGLGVLRNPEDEDGGGGDGQAALFDEPAAEPKDKAEPAGGDRLAKLEQKIDEQNGFLANFFQRPQQQPQPPSRPDPGAQKKQFEEAFFQDPARFSAQVAQHAAANQANQLRGELHPMQVQMAQQDARQKDPELYDKYSQEVTEWVRDTYGPADWTNPFVWNQALKNVKADKLDEIAEWKAQKKKAAASINAPSRRGFSGEEPKGLSDEERTMADFLGMSHGDYEEARKGWTNDSKAPTTGRKMLDSGWSNVITLDSRKPRKTKRANA